MGGSKRINMTTNVNAVIAWRVLVLNCTVIGKKLILPSANVPPVNTGGPCFYILNIGNQSFTVRDNGDNTTIATILPGKFGLCVCYNNDDANGGWFIETSDIRGGGGYHTTTATGTTPGSGPGTNTGGTSITQSIMFPPF